MTTGRINQVASLHHRAADLHTNTLGVLQQTEPREIATRQANTAVLAHQAVDGDLAQRVFFNSSTGSNTLFPKETKLERQSTCLPRLSTISPRLARTRHRRPLSRAKNPTMVRLTGTMQVLAKAERDKDEAMSRTPAVFSEAVISPETHSATEGE